MFEEIFSGSVKKVAANAFAVGAIILAGCGEKPKPAEHAKDEEPVAIGPQYSAKKGLLVPKLTSESLGVKIVEVTEGQVAESLNLKLRVYRATASEILASASIPTEKAKLLQKGQKVILPQFENFSGEVKGMDSAMARATGLGEILVEIPSAITNIALGTFVQGRVTLQSSNTVVTVPRAALLQCSDGYSVYTVSGDHFVRTPIKVGAIGEELVEVTDGLYSGDKVVLQSVMSLWMTELAAIKGGQACCVEPAKKK